MEEKDWFLTTGKLKLLFDRRHPLQTKLKENWHIGRIYLQPVQQEKGLAKCIRNPKHKKDQKTKHWKGNTKCQ